MESTSTSELRKALSKYALPSANELIHLRAADPTTSYRSSYFRLQIDELLAVTGRKLNAKASSGLQSLLFQVKEILQNIQDQQVTQDALQARGLLVRNHVKHKEIVLPFQHPARLDLVGSYILQTMAYSGKKSMDYGNISIDVAVEMPHDCFLPKDFGNYRYFDKRNLYLGVLASELQIHTTLFSQIKLQAWRGDYGKPIVVLSVNSDYLREHGLHGIKVLVRLVPAVTTELFKLAKLVPSRNNIKHEPDMTEDEMKGCSTPMYNNSILEDMKLRQHTRDLHIALKEAPQLAEACILAKVWLRQREFHKAMDSVNGFLLSMVLLYLYEKKRFNAQTPSDQIFKVLMQFLALHPLENEPLQFPPSDDGVVLTTEGMHTFRRSFELVFLDASGRLNLFSRVSKSAWKEIQSAAIESVTLVQQCTTNAFRSLFIEKKSFWTRYDQYFWFPAPFAIEEAKNDTYTVEEKRQINDMGLERFWLQKLGNVLSNALTDRVTLIRPMTEDSVEWNMQDSALPKQRKVAVGLCIDSNNAMRIVDKGPSADDKEASARFRNFWRGKSELRRFKDGAIVEALIWEGIGTDNRHRVLDAIVRYIVPAHCPYVLSSQIKTSNAALYSVLDVDETPREMPSSLNASFENAMNSVSKLWVIFNNFAKTLRGLDSLPLMISDVLPVHPAFRSTSLFPIQPHPLAYSKGEVIDAAPMAHASTVLEPLVLHLKFERSSAWPNEKKALMHAKTGFYVHIGQELQSRLKIRCEVANDCLDVFRSGFVFRLIIRCEKELSVVTGATGVKKLAIVNSPNYVMVKREVEYLSRHASLVHALHTKHNSFGPTVRLAQQWLADKILSNVLPIEALELLVADVYLAAASTSIPHSILSSFLRFLKRVASFDWQNLPFIVDFNNSLDDEKRREIYKCFEASKTSPNSHPGMFIAVDYEAMDCLSSWTRFKLDKVVVQRLCLLAQNSFDVLVSWLSSGASSSGWKKAFATSRKEFDAVLQLATKSLPTKRIRVHGDKKHSFVTSLYKNMDMTAVPVMIGFDPVQELLQDLERTFGHLAFFFINAVEATEILITWKPQAFLPDKFRAITANYQMPLSFLNVAKEDPTPCLAIPNVFEILSDMQTMSNGIVVGIALHPFESL
ncbi:Nucleolar RNA-associated protein (NRAP) [Plasmopara halstedii]|uniref:Nucleolar RNA-associated protein (NRAP) n=1 Tax=Plasmopara halstedii TaxID=4781 RepID=A0A0P1ATN5_PLAHL|nr:Nucleolar RNA-associated protein (NRAP) [Plasmopara halstedii]CEG45684.1 Nucleolar RNA-associated protein (NRAP) [Plasmopara halstedii]|eukprot:XP_024582053.1 Nucleolar RNA-associated protein (NRAP) [Plasmopara halstedii]